MQRLQLLLLFPAIALAIGCSNPFFTNFENDVDVQECGLHYVAHWGSPGTGNGQFTDPNGIAVGSDETVYVADKTRVQIFGTAGNYIGQLQFSFRSAWGVAVDGSGVVYVSDVYFHKVYKFDSSGALVTEWGGLGSGDGQLSAPMGIAVDAAGANVFVYDTGNSRVQKFTSAGAFVAAWGSFSCVGSLFCGLAFDPLGNLWVSDYGIGGLHQFDASGSPLAGIYFHDYYGSVQIHPQGIAIDPISGSKFIAHGKVYSPGNGLYFGSYIGDSSLGTESAVYNLAADGLGNYYLLDRDQCQVQLFSQNPY